MRLHLPSTNSFFFSIDFHPSWQLYANFPTALLDYHLEQMLRALRNGEVTKTINLAQQPGWAASGCSWHLVTRGRAQPHPAAAFPPLQHPQQQRWDQNSSMETPRISSVGQRRGRCDLSTCSKTQGNYLLDPHGF